MQLLHDFYLVAVDQLFESGVTPSGIITSNTAIIHPEQEDRGEFKRRYGVVLEKPVGFSDLAISMVDPGLPPPKKYISHDWIEMMRTYGHTNYDGKFYYPSTFEKYEEITCKQIAELVDVEIGEKIYFDEKATEAERYMGTFEGKSLYSVRVDEIICSVREKLKKTKVIAQGQWVLLKPKMEDWEDILIPIPGKPKEEWLQAKVSPDTVWLTGTVHAVNRRNDLQTGDTVIFMRDADAPITVEGEELTCMYNDEVLAKIR
jgi:co-chaperonin GroES (HSP10)